MDYGKTMADEPLNQILPFARIEWRSPGCVRVVTDHAASIPVYYHQSRDHVAVGMTPWEVAKTLPIRRLDPVSVADFLINGTVCYPHTLFEDVFVAPPGATTDITTKGVESASYYLPREEVGLSASHEWGECLRSRVDQVLSEGLRDSTCKVKVLFSGGEDSRAVASLLRGRADIELVTFADGYNREVRLAEQAAKALGLPLQFIKRPPEFYRKDIELRTQLIGGAFDVRHTHAWGVLADSLRDADVLVGGYGADTLFKSAGLGNVTRQRKRLAPEKLQYPYPTKPVGIGAGSLQPWLNNEIGGEVDRRRLRHHERLLEFRPTTAGNWHTLWPLGSQRLAYAHYLALRQIGPVVIEPFLAPQVYRLAAVLPDVERTDRKAFRAAFRRPMGRAAWIPGSSGDLPGLGGYPGRFVRSAVYRSRQGMDFFRRRAASLHRRAALSDAAWSEEQHSFAFQWSDFLSCRSVEKCRLYLKPMVSIEGDEMLFGSASDLHPNIVKNRALQIGVILSEL